jgi:hypothetical protein
MSHKRGRRIRGATVNLELLSDLFLGGRLFISNLPKDAKVLRVNIDTYMGPNTVVVYFGSDSFDFVPEGTIIPMGFIVEMREGAPDAA